MSYPALFAGIASALFGAAFAVQVMKRRWWAAGGVFAVGSATLLNVVTIDNYSPAVHNVRLAVSIILLACWAFAIFLDGRARRRNRLAPAPARRSGRRPGVVWPRAAGCRRPGRAGRWCSAGAPPRPAHPPRLVRRRFYVKLSCSVGFSTLERRRSFTTGKSYTKTPNEGPASVQAGPVAR